MKVAILGTVPDSRVCAPFDDPEWDIWVCSAGNRGGVVPRVSAWFELHGVIDLKGAENRGWVPDYFAWLKAQAFAVYMQEPNDLLTQALVFPHRAILSEFGDRGRINLTSSIAWMIAFAILKGADEIGIFGVDMAATEEHYGGQKAGCLNWIQIARERDIKVHVPLESCLSAMPPLYGYGEATRLGRRLVVQELTLRATIGQVDSDIARLTGERHMMAGALDRVQYMRRTFVDGAEAELGAEDDVLADTAERPALMGAPAVDQDTDFERIPTTQVGGVFVPNFAAGKLTGQGVGQVMSAIDAVGQLGNKKPVGRKRVAANGGQLSEAVEP